VPHWTSQHTPNVARELVGNECAVSVVWHHELRHFAIVQESLATTASELERMMRAYYDGAVLVGSEAETQEQIEREFRGRWTTEFETLQARGNLAHEENTPTGKAIRAALVEITDYLDCVMVKRDGCEADFNAKEQKRRQGDKKAIKLD